MATSAFSTVLFGVLIFMLFNNRKKAAVYALAGVCGGSLGVALGCIGCMVFKTASLLQLSTPIYQAAAEALAGKLLGLTAGGAAVLFAVGYIVLVYMYKTAERKSKRNMIF